MNITPISTNETAFNGKLTVKEAAEQMKATFSGTGMLNIRKSPFAGTPATEALSRLKRFVAFFSDSVGAHFNKELTYPDISKFAAEYKVDKNSATIDVPEHFSIRLDV